MGWGIKLKAPKIKLKAPKITVGKDLGVKNIGKVASDVVKTAGKAGEDIGRGVGKGATAAYQTAGKYGSAITNTVGKGVEGIVANTADIAENLAQGDFKGVGSESLQLLQSGKDVIKGAVKANTGLYTGALGAVGSSLSDKNITGTAQNLEREANKGVNTYGDAAIDMGANALTAGTYGLAKQAAQGLSSEGLGGLVSGKGLQDMALGAAGSYAGIDPNMLKMGMSAAQGDLKGAALQGLSSYGGIDPNILKMGMSAAQGDLKNAALQGLSSYAGLSPEQMKMASTGISALTGDKKGLASGLASQFGAGDEVSGLIGNLAGGNMDFKKMALEGTGP